MDETKKEMLTREYNYYKVSKSHFEVQLATCQARLGDLNTQLMFAEAEELQEKGENKCKL